MLDGTALQGGREMAMKHVPGNKAGDIKVYTLSTCPWCHKVKKLLADMGVEYHFVDVDLLTGDERENTLMTVKKWNPSTSFPTIVIGDSKCIVGFKENEIREAVKGTAK
jgi:glutaredoxin-like protein NrdH